MRKAIFTILILMLSVFMGACGSGTGTDNEEQDSSLRQSVGLDEAGENQILILYFTRAAVTNFSEDVDTESSASIQLVDGSVKGNTQLIAEMIYERVGGDVFCITTMNTYPTDYDEALDYAMDEQNRDYRPELAEPVYDFEKYNTVFLGFPLWWYDMPMAMYSLLEEYDFAGKTVIPFNTSGGSGFSNTMETLEEILPEGQLLEGFTVRDDKASASEEDIVNWLEKLGFQ